MTNENIDAIFSRNGSFSPHSKVPPDVISAYRGKLPDILLEIWESHGVGVWGEGIFQLCMPDAFNGLLSQIFHADDDFSHQDCHVIGYGPFGYLLVWSERHWMTHIHLNRSEIICPGLIAPERKRSTESIIATVLFGISKNVTNLGYDEDDKPLFTRARKKLGNLDIGQAFGFFPALAMGGAPRLENLRIVPALEHFLFLAQLQPFNLVDYLANPPRIVREIG